MKNNQLIWGNTLLVAYRYLGTLCRSIDKIVQTTAMHSFYSGGNWDEGNSVMNISKKIIKLTDKKVDYINLKILVEKILSKLNKDNAKILVLKYIKELSSNTICNLLNINERTYYRRVNKALNEFANEMVKMGYTYQKMEVSYYEDKFIKSIYDLINNNNLTSTEIFEFQDDFLTKYVYKLSTMALA